MDTQRARKARIPRSLILLITLMIVAAVSGLSATGAGAAEPTGDPAASGSPLPSAAPEVLLCESAADLRLIIGFLQETSISEDGMVPTIVGVIAGLHEARQLVGFVDAAYRPLVEGLVTSLQGLRTTIDGLGDEATLGAGIASIGEAITAIGLAMDELAVALREPCPTLDSEEA
jgi:hypothetical protein